MIADEEAVSTEASAIWKARVFSSYCSVWMPRQQVKDDFCYFDGTALTSNTAPSCWALFSFLKTQKAFQRCILDSTILYKLRWRLGISPEYLMMT